MAGVIVTVDASGRRLNVDYPTEAEPVVQRLAEHKWEIIRILTSRCDRCRRPLQETDVGYIYCGGCAERVTTAEPCVN